MMTIYKTKSDKVAMSESGIMTNFKSSAWRVARGAVIMTLMIVGLTSVAHAALNTYYYKGDSNFAAQETVAGTTTNVWRACSTAGNTAIGGAVPQIASAGGAWDSCR